jgi:acyl-CoA thioesterase FadM
MILSLVLKSFLPDLEYLLINWIQSIDLTFSQNQQKHSLSDVIHYSCRVLPHDIDRNCHMNNSVYFKQLNYARKHFWNQLGVWKHLYVKKYNMVVSAQSIRFRRELKLWDNYEISIRLISWCDKSRCFYLESQFLRKGFVHAIHWTKYNLVGKDSPKPSEILFSCSLISSKDAKSILMNDEDLSLWIQANQLSSEKLNPKKKS